MPASRCIDTADAYCWDDTDRGHNERLIAQALASWSGDRARIIVATKGGLTRPDGAWAADGRARHLAEACRASCRALGVDRIALYQLHAPDPRVPLATSVRALAAVQRDGLIDRIGLCNVTVGQIEQARRIVAIDAVQIELGVICRCRRRWRRGSALPRERHPHPRVPAARRCHAHAARCRSRASRRGGAAWRDTRRVALAWLADLSPLIVPLPGATRVETAQSAAREPTIALTDDDRQQLDDRFPHGRIVRGGAAAPPQAAPAARDVPKSC